MAKKSDDMADGMIADDREGWLANLLADEEPYDRHKLWQLGSWAAATLGALTFAFLAAQSSNAMRGDLASANELVLRNLQLAEAAAERETDGRRLTSAIDILNADRDRLYARVTGLEQNLDSVTSSIKPRAPLDPIPFASSAPPILGVPETVLAQPSPAPIARAVIDEKSPLPKEDKASTAARAAKDALAAQPPASAALAPETTKPPEPTQITKVAPDIAAASPPDPAPSVIVTAAIPPAEPNPAEIVPEIRATKTEFGIDLGTASSLEGLRALWRGVQTSNKALMAPLRPIVTLKERSGLGMQLRLVAGPLADAAAAARICAVLSENERPCETAFFDGQRLASGAEVRTDAPAARPAPPPRRKRSSARASRSNAAVAPRPQRTGFSSFLGGN